MRILSIKDYIYIYISPNPRGCTLPTVILSRDISPREINVISLSQLQASLWLTGPSTLSPWVPGWTSSSVFATPKLLSLLPPNFYRIYWFSVPDIHYLFPWNIFYFLDSYHISNSPGLLPFPEKASKSCWNNIPASPSSPLWSILCFKILKQYIYVYVYIYYTYNTMYI